MENFGYLYSVAVVAGGLVGYIKKGSLPYWHPLAWPKVSLKAIRTV